MPVVLKCWKLWKFYIYCPEGSYSCSPGVSTKSGTKRHEETGTINCVKEVRGKKKLWEKKRKKCWWFSELAWGERWVKNSFAANNWPVATDEWTVFDITLALSFLPFLIHLSIPTRNPPPVSDSSSITGKITQPIYYLLARRVKQHVTCHTWRRTCRLLAPAATLHFSSIFLSLPLFSSSSSYPCFLSSHPSSSPLLTPLHPWPPVLMFLVLALWPVAAFQSVRCCHKSNWLFQLSEHREIQSRQCLCNTGNQIIHWRKKIKKIFPEKLLWWNSQWKK